MQDDTTSGFSVTHTPPPEADDVAIARLASLAALEYERCRIDEAKLLRHAPPSSTNW